MGVFFCVFLGCVKLTTRCGFAWLQVQVIRPDPLDQLEGTKGQVGVVRKGSSSTFGATPLVCLIEPVLSVIANQPGAGVTKGRWVVVVVVCWKKIGCRVAAMDLVMVVNGEEGSGK